MRPNLSLETLATVLAALGTTAVMACTKADSAAVHSDQPAQGASAAQTAAAAAPTAGPTEAERKAAEPMATTVIAAPSASGAAGASGRGGGNVPRRVPGNGGSGTTGQASCGAGTCTADPKKK